jgi:phage terminase large subunit GpA-like protein
MAAPAFDLQAPRELAAARARYAAMARGVFAEVFAARVRMTVLEWSDTRRWLSPEANALAAEAQVPVRYSSALTPYHREILLACSSPATEIIVVKFPSQDGKTEIVNNFIGERIDLEPGPMLVMQPTRELADAWSKDRLAPMLRDTPALRGKVRDARARDSDNTILHKKFPGGHLTAVGSNSAAGLSARPIRDVVVDEVDRCARSAGIEGDPIGLAGRRASTFRRGKKIYISSPTTKGQSRIDSEYQLGTQEEWHVPCPHCGEYQFLVWGGTDVTHGLKWAAETPDAPYYVCLQGCVIEEHHKAWMIANGRWVAQNPSAGPRRRSFWKNQLASNLVAWRKIVAEWRELQENRETKREQLRQFVNTVLCELFDPVEGEEISAEGLLARLGTGYPDDNAAGPGTVPAGVAVLVRTCDTQGYGIETAVWGFGEGEEAWLIDWELCEGDPTTRAPFQALDEARAKTYRHASGLTIAPELTFIDSGGHHTKEVYAYCRTRIAQRVYAIKGSNNSGAPLLGKATRPDNAKTVLFPVGSFTGKLTLMRRLVKVPEPGPGFIHLPAWLQPDQITQFTNERLVSKVMPGGKRLSVWDAVGRTEQGHLYVYALAALQKLGLAAIRNLGARAKQLAIEGELARAKAEEAAANPPTEPSTPEPSPRSRSFRANRRPGKWGGGDA